MGNGALFFTAQLRCGFTFRRNKEYWVVTKAAAACGFASDDARPAAVANQRGGIFRMAQIDQHAVELRLAPIVRHVAQRVEQLFEIALVGRVFAGIAGGIDAGRAA